jgi:ubiquinone/menaquinone biosynthesis C-methylase UbiE
MPVETRPYSQLAAYYDEIMNHVDYKRWARHIKTIISHYRQKPENIVDLACGTGAIFKYLKSKKWTLYGGDRSFDMISQGYQKQFSPACYFFCSDFCSVPIKKEYFDVALILYDSVNYLIEDEDISRMFSEVSLTLKNGGMFIFDVVTPYVCRTAFRDYTEQKFWGQSGYTRKSWYEEHRFIQHNEFEIYTGSDIYKEQHQQRIRYQEEWEDYIDRSPLELLAAYHNFSFRKAKNKSERIHFVCRKLL